VKAERKGVWKAIWKSVRKAADAPAAHRSLLVFGLPADDPKQAAAHRAAASAAHALASATAPISVAATRDRWNLLGTERAVVHETVHLLRRGRLHASS
jgi:hypothetical protein